MSRRITVDSAGGPATPQLPPTATLLAPVSELALAGTAWPPMRPGAGKACRSEASMLMRSVSTFLGSRTSMRSVSEVVHSAPSCVTPSPSSATGPVTAPVLTPARLATAAMTAASPEVQNTWPGSERLRDQNTTTEYTPWPWTELASEPTGGSCTAWPAVPVCSELATGAPKVRVTMSSTEKPVSTPSVSAASTRKRRG